MSHTIRTRVTAIAALAALTLAGCSSDPEPTADSGTSGTSTATAASGGATGTDRESDTDRQKIPRLRAYLHSTMAFGAPMINFDKDGELREYADEIDVDYWDSVDQLRAAMMQGDAQVAATPAYTAANLYNKGIDVRLIGQVVWGMLYVLGPDTAEEGNWDELKGQKVAVVMPGEMVDLVFSYLLAENGLDKESDITYVPVNDPRQAVGMLAKGEVDWAVLPEHLATVALKKTAESGKNLKRVFNLQEEYGKATGGPARFPMAGLIMPGELVDAHPELPAAILDEVTDTTAKVNGGDDATIKAIAEQYEMPEQLVRDIIPRLNLEVVPASESRKQYEEFLKILATVNPDVYGGTLPDDRFYAE
ncbi:ABC transporter substrate-binding protein [Corynebacterium sp. CCM 9185]|uniref:ABC transporter substrate-binding protein n=1 Tax=Corynebacterium marambiense TaxID=2765364 RepID=A0ABS0VX12_9CORY|nr:ABC transporter substrate-binding protein [Corynebacterium marambiense]MBI9001315.1 ABC transporter substrate-binding protein [Corynebacterium marambiense]MCK7663870.1 ABC transporter substrate-binding protein [Corynebacterium marambiense]MCX7543019.1 ABC transporter substrate-binding protein [Corynebacterium marambiense]